MKICVYGLWHLGTVIASCLAEAGFDTVGLDPDPVVIEGLCRGNPPLFEPGLAELVGAGLASEKLSFTAERAAALAGADIVWVAFDTPVDEEDRADAEWVNSRVAELFPLLGDGTVVLISSQLPVGNTEALRTRYAAAVDGRVAFAYSPENLRLGAALERFRKPERIVIGVRDDTARGPLTAVLARFSDQLLWMSVESAEMVKHAINAFLATCIVFTNEVSALCETVGADAYDVERGLRSEPRIGLKAYVRPGPAFGGGTLARDLQFLGALAARNDLTLPLLRAALPSNDEHRRWAVRRLERALGDLTGKTVALWGLAYKADTDSLRRSLAIDLCRWLVRAGARVRAYDPKVAVLPKDLASTVVLAPTMEAALDGADGLVVATEWNDFRAIDSDSLVARMRCRLVIDPHRFLERQFGSDHRISYVIPGRAP